MYRIGIDLGGTNIAVGVVDDRHNIIAEASVPTGAFRPAEEMVADMCRAVELALDKAGLIAADCASIGIGSPGTCDSEAGVVMRAYNLGWFNVPVCRMLHERFGIPVRLSNDANCAALAETVAGAAVGRRDMILITLGTGVGGGIIIDGKLMEGYMSAGAEIGHMVICEGGALCTCGRHGCLEAYASATALIRLTKWKMELDCSTKMWEIAGGKLENVDGKTAFLAARAGDMRGKEVVDEYVEHLAVGLANLANVLRPEAILLGGGVSNEGEYLFAPLRTAVEKKLYTSVEFVPLKIEKAALGNDAGIWGAFALAKGL